MTEKGAMGRVLEGERGARDRSFARSMRCQARCSPPRSRLLLPSPASGPHRIGPPSAWSRRQCPLHPWSGKGSLTFSQSPGEQYSIATRRLTDQMGRRASSARAVPCEWRSGGPATRPRAHSIRLLERCKPTMLLCSLAQRRCSRPGGIVHDATGSLATFARCWAGVGWDGHNKRVAMGYAVCCLRCISAMYNKPC